MTTRKFNIEKSGELKALFLAANARVTIAIGQRRIIAVQLEAELSLHRTLLQSLGQPAAIAATR